MSLAKAKIAVLGATGYIGRSLTFALSERGMAVTPVSRDVEKAKKVFATYDIRPGTPAIDYETFSQTEFDVVINATGIGSPKIIATEPAAVFVVTEDMDKLLFGYLEQYPQTQVFNISSGSVYGLTAGQPITADSLSTFSPNRLSAGDFYNLAKLSSEGRHRARADLNITDLRVFSFFSQFTDSADRFLLSEITACLEQGKLLETSAADIVRDFSNADLLVHLISFLFDWGRENAVYDVVSQQPITKFALLEELAAKWGLAYQVTADEHASVTGVKNTYCGDSSGLDALGYKPKQDSLTIILSELEKRLDR